MMDVVVPPSATPESRRVGSAGEMSSDFVIAERQEPRGADKSPEGS